MTTKQKSQVAHAIVLRDSLADALERNGVDSDHCYTLVSTGPLMKALHIRPELASVHANGERIYVLNGRQTKKAMNIITAELERIG